MGPYPLRDYLRWPKIRICICVDLLIDVNENLSEFVSDEIEYLSGSAIDFVGNSIDYLFGSPVDVVGDSIVYVIEMVVENLSYFDFVVIHSFFG